MPAPTHDPGAGWLTPVGQGAGFVLFFAILWAPAPPGLSPEAQRLAAVTGLMAVFWLTQALPIAATSLIPLVAFPLLGIQSADEISQAYINSNVILFLGGFIVALGMEKCGLHRRLALHIVRLIGSSPRRVVLGFMLATAFLSMWISNTASTLLMMPIGLALLASLTDFTVDANQTSEPTASSLSLKAAPPLRQKHPAVDRLSVVLMIAIAYSASIGGLTTLVGTPTNVQFQQIWRDKFPHGPELSAGQWTFAFGPLGLLFLLITWAYLCWRLPVMPGAERLNRRFFTEQLQKLCRPSRAEWMMGTVFAMTAALWIFRKPLRFGQDPITPGWEVWTERFLLWLGADAELAAKAVNDSTVAMAMALLMFFLPAARDEAGRIRYLMDWSTVEKLPWGILLLFGGGFAIASGFDQTGLSQWVGAGFADVIRDWPVWLIILSICLLLTFLTEFTSNVATLSALLPILAGTAISIGLDPRLIMFPAAISTSCAFMLPIATPPNAIVFGSGHVQIRDMVRAGFALNLLGAVLITLVTFLLLIPQLGISLEMLPEWAASEG
jgi:solute carrier family 13 (sodium-dependent dicarboxylate transporter), member 2/3/5